LNFVAHYFSCFIGLLVGAEFSSGENLLSDAARSGDQMNFHHFHGVYPSCTSGVVERKMGCSDAVNRILSGSAQTSEGFHKGFAESGEQSCDGNRPAVFGPRNAVHPDPELAGSGKGCAQKLNFEIFILE
jgi:hypothetical protein